MDPSLVMWLLGLKDPLPSCALTILIAEGSPAEMMLHLVGVGVLTTVSMAIDAVLWGV
jgi:hypothetical protein